MIFSFLSLVKHGWPQSEKGTHHGHAAKVHSINSNKRNFAESSATYPTVLVSITTLPAQKSLGTLLTIGRRHTRNDGVHLHQGFHIYGTDNSLEKGYSGYERVLKEDEQNPMKSTSNISETPSGELRVVVVTPENDQSRNARVALLRATSMKAIYPPEGSVMFDEI